MANESNIKDELKVLFKEHDYNQLYYKQDIVTYEINGTINFYQAIRNVPRYVPITDRTYWNQLNISEGNSEGSSEGNTPVDDVDYLCFTANEDNSTLQVLCYIGEGYTEEESNSFPESAEFNTSDMTPHKNPPFVLEYSIDKINWSILNMYQIVHNESSALISDVIDFEHTGDKIYFRADNINGTTFYDDSNEDLWYEAKFVSDSGSSFSVSGDLQTIVDKTGNDKENGRFDYLFSTEVGSVSITSAPDLTATSFIDNKYTCLFQGQSELLHPATMPNITISDLENLTDVFSAMYSYSCIQEPANFNSIVINSAVDEHIFSDNFISIYEDTSFDITNDNITLLGFSGIVFDITEDAYSIADGVLKNTNGFTLGDHSIQVSVRNGTFVNIDAPDGVFITNQNGGRKIDYNQDLTGEEVIIYTAANPGYWFLNYETSIDGGETWEVEDTTPGTGGDAYDSAYSIILPSKPLMIRINYTDEK